MALRVAVPQYEVCSPNHNHDSWHGHHRYSMFAYFGTLVHSYNVGTGSRSLTGNGPHHACWLRSANNQGQLQSACLRVLSALEALCAGTSV